MAGSTIVLYTDTFPMSSLLFRVPWPRAKGCRLISGDPIGSRYVNDAWILKNNNEEVNFF